MPQIEERTAKIEGILEQMSERISDLREEVSSLRADFNSLRADLDTKVEGLRQEMGKLNQGIQDNFRWTMAIMIGSWVTIVGIMITLFTTMR